MCVCGGGGGGGGGFPLGHEQVRGESVCVWGGGREEGGEASLSAVSR